MEINGMRGYTREEMQAEFDVLGFAYGYCVVKRKADGREGTLSFKAIDNVRYYYDFVG